jgi:hypothetical protein
VPPSTMMRSICSRHASWAGTLLALQPACATNPPSVHTAAVRAKQPLQQALRRVMPKGSIPDSDATCSTQLEAFQGGVDEALSGVQFLSTHKTVRDSPDGKQHTACTKHLDQSEQSRCCAAGFSQTQAALTDFLLRLGDASAREEVMSRFGEDQRESKAALQACYRQFVDGKVFASQVCGYLLPTPAEVSDRQGCWTFGFTHRLKHFQNTAVFKLKRKDDPTYCSEETSPPLEQRLSPASDLKNP